MTITNHLQRIVALGFAGVQVWEGTTKGVWCGCLLSNDPYCKPLHYTNLWNYVSTVEEVFEILAKTAETIAKEQASAS